jgi:hypothetical protein
MNQKDGNDVDGRLDVRAVRFDHNPAPSWTFVTFGSWTLEEIWDRGQFVVRLDTRADEDNDLLIVVRSDGRQMLANLFRIRADGREIDLGKVQVDKISRRGLEVTVALRKLGVGRGRTSYTWTALALLTSASCRTVCIDRIPDEGRVEQLLPGVSPSPSPTPTETPSPEP